MFFVLQGSGEVRIGKQDTLVPKTLKVNRGEIAGIVTLVARHGKVAHFSAIVYADVSTQWRMETDATFRLYSMTKPIAATALMMLYEQGRFQLDNPTSKYLPEFVGNRVLRHPDSELSDTVPPLREPTATKFMAARR